MSATYQTITGYTGYKYGIYDNGAAIIQVRRDGKRFRTLVDGVRWQGNTGGHHTTVTYLTREQGRQMVRQIRRAQIRAATLDGQRSGCCQMDVRDIMTGSY